MDAVPRGHRPPTPMSVLLCGGRPPPVPFCAVPPPNDSPASTRRGVSPAIPFLSGGGEGGCVSSTPPSMVIRPAFGFKNCGDGHVRRAVVKGGDRPDRQAWISRARLLRTPPQVLARRRPRQAPLLVPSPNWATCSIYAIFIVVYTEATRLLPTSSRPPLADWRVWDTGFVTLPPADSEKAWIGIEEAVAPVLRGRVFR